MSVATKKSVPYPSWKEGERSRKDGRLGRLGAALVEGLCSGQEESSLGCLLIPALPMFGVAKDCHQRPVATTTAGRVCCLSRHVAEVVNRSDRDTSRSSYSPRYEVSRFAILTVARVHQQIGRGYLLSNICPVRRSATGHGVGCT